MDTDTFGGRATRNFRQNHADDPAACVPDAWGYCPCPLEEAPPQTAELVCSDVGMGLHKPVIDLDLPAKLVPSGTPGHSHLYLEQEVPFEDYMRILEALAFAGIVQWGFHDSTRERGFGSVRHPNRPKKVDE
jgi:hypothetical protein